MHNILDADSALPTQRAFVLQLRGDADAANGELSGRVEHVRTGQAQFFDSIESLVTFIAHVLHTNRTAPR